MVSGLLVVGSYDFFLTFFCSFFLFLIVTIFSGNKIFGFDICHFCSFHLSPFLSWSICLLRCIRHGNDQWSYSINFVRWMAIKKRLIKWQIMKFIGFCCLSIPDRHQAMWSCIHFRFSYLMDSKFIIPILDAFVTILVSEEYYGFLW